MVPRAKFSFAELRWVAPAMLAVLILQLYVFQATYLFKRWFWMDEVFTYEFARAPTWDAAWTGLKSGLDRHPPFMLTLFRYVNKLLPWSPEVSLRVFVFAFAFLTLLGLYVLVRRRYDRLIAACAAAAAWCLPVMQYNAFEGRVYAVWIAALVWLCVAVEYSIERGAGSKPWALAVAVLSMITATTHYLGIVSLAVCVFPYFIIRPPGWARALAPMLAGAVVFAALCVPLNAAQSHVSMEDGALPHIDLQAALGFWLIVSPIAMTVLVLPWVATFVKALATRSPQLTEEGMSAIASLVFFPFVLIAISMVSTQVYLGRYGSPVVLVAAPVAAYWLADRARTAQLAALIGLLVISGYTLNVTTENRRAYMDTGRGGREVDDDWGPTLAAIKQKANEAPIVSQPDVMAYTLGFYAPGLAQDFIGTVPKRRDAPPNPQMVRTNTYVFDMMKAFSRTRGYPKTVEWDELKKAHPHFFYVEALGGLSVPASELDGCTARPTAAHLFEVTCADEVAPSSPAAPPPAVH